MSTQSHRTVLVTGGARGIGAGIARSFAEAGFNVMIGDLSVPGDWSYGLAGADDADKVAEGLGEHGVRSRAVPLDVSDPESCQDAVAATLEVRRAGTERS